MKFIADAMLGRLARWLRFLGYDTLYYSGISDSSLIKLAREQDRVVLTRDTRLIKIKGLNNYLLIISNDSFQQLLEVIGSLKLRQFDMLSRCVKCNGELIKIIDKVEIKDAVPEYVFLQHNEFLECLDCGKIYWGGSHPNKFKERVGRIFKTAS
jgi:uncharacterized protein